MKEEVKERKNKMWKVKYKEIYYVKNMVGAHDQQKYGFLKNLQNDSQYSNILTFIHYESMDTLLRIFPY